MLRWCLSTGHILGGRVGSPPSARVVSSASLRANTNPPRSRGPASVKSCSRYVSFKKWDLVQPPKDQKYINQDFFESSQSAAEPMITDVPEPNRVPTPTTNLSSKPEALDVLHAFLSHNPTAFLALQKHTPNTLRTLYKHVKRRSQLSQLGSMRISTLISVFGSLSIPALENHCFHARVFMSRVTVHSERSYWAFLLEMGGDKERLGMRLSHVDRYWMMRAELSIYQGSVKACECTRSFIFVYFLKSLADRNPNSAISRARKHYIRISQHSSQTELHETYIRGLLKLRGPNSLQEAIHTTCDVLERLDHCPPRLVTLLWEIVLSYGAEAPLTLKQRLVSTLCDRLNKAYTNGRGKGPHPSVTPHGLIRADTNAGAFSRAIGVRELTVALRFTLFSSGDNTHHPNLHLWARSQAQSALSPDTPSADSWSNLILLAMASAATHATSPTPSFDSAYKAQTFVADWGTVTSLVSLENSLNGVDLFTLPRERAQSIKDILWTLWASWSESYDVAASNPIVVRGILTSFFRIASSVLYAPLVYACFQWSVTNKSWLTNTKGLMDEKQLSLLGTEFAAASIACRNQTLESLFDELGCISLRLEWVSNIAGQLILRYVEHDLQLAQHIHQLCHTRGLLLQSECIQTLTLSLAYSDSPSLAIPILVNSHLAQRDAERVLQVLFSRLPLGCLDSDQVLAISKMMLALCRNSSPSLKLRTQIQSLVLALPAFGNSATALDLVQSIHRSSPTFFRSSFFLRFLRITLAHRQFLHAVSFVRFTAKGAPLSLATRLRAVLIAGLMRRGASNLARKESNAAPIIGRAMAVSFPHMVGFKLKSPKRLAALKVKIKATDLSNRHRVQCISNVLLTGNRPLAALKLFERTRDTLNVTARTSLGNAIISSTVLRPSKRNGRQVRKVLATMKLLVEKHGFVPDRITVNILLKAIMRWRNTIDGSRLRALFDHMIRSGYPIAPRWRRSLGVPFGTVSNSAQSLDLPQLPSFMSFERHVRPLYKMFIKAFYIRGDVEAAKIVVGILKMEKEEVFRRRAARSAGRFSGRLEDKSRTSQGPRR